MLPHGRGRTVFRRAVSGGPSKVPRCAARKYRHYTSGDRRYSTYCHVWLFPSTPSDFTWGHCRGTTVTCNVELQQSAWAGVLCGWFEFSPLGGPSYMRLLAAYPSKIGP